MGWQTGDLLRTTIESASHRTSGTLATLVGIVTLFVTASGVFGEMQLSLNKIWKIDTPAMSLSRLVRARAASLGLVALLVSWRRALRFPRLALLSMTICRSAHSSSP